MIHSSQIPNQPVFFFFAVCCWTYVQQASKSVPRACWTSCLLASPCLVPPSKSVPRACWTWPAIRGHRECAKPRSPGPSPAQAQPAQAKPSQAKPAATSSSFQLPALALALAKPSQSKSRESGKGGAAWTQPTHLPTLPTRTHSTGTHHPPTQYTHTHIHRCKPRQARPDVAQDRGGIIAPAARKPAPLFPAFPPPAAKPSQSWVPAWTSPAKPRIDD